MRKIRTLGSARGGLREKLVYSTGYISVIDLFSDNIYLRFIDERFTNKKRKFFWIHS